MPRRTWLLVTTLAALGASTDLSLADDPAPGPSADRGDVVMQSISYNGWNYSQLDQITPENVGLLQPDLLVRIDLPDAFAAAPLVVGDRMFIVSPKPNQVYALDLAGAGDIVWRFVPDMDTEEATRIVCCGGQTRGLSFSDGKLFFATLDGQLFALHAETGEPVWRTVVGELAAGEATTGNVLVTDDLVIVGNARTDRGIRGRIQAYEVGTGQHRWTMYNMGPEADVGITASYRAFYSDNLETLSTWFEDSWQRGGGTVSGLVTWDPELDLIYYSSGSCSPLNPDIRRERGVVRLDDNGGLVDYRNNWCGSQIAREADTGVLRWAFNMTPADVGGFDDAAPTLLIDGDIDGTPRGLAAKSAYSGFFFLWDRATGELVNEPQMLTYVTWADGFDMATGRARMNMDAWPFGWVSDRRRYTNADPGRLPDGARIPDYTGTEARICPLPFRTNQVDAYSPQTGLFYSAVSPMCSTVVALPGRYTIGEPFVLRRSWPESRTVVETDREAPDFGEPVAGGIPGSGGVLAAFDPLSGRDAWRLTWLASNTGGVLATAGGLVFQYGNDEGALRAIRAETGEILWEFRTGDRSAASPITYLGPDGRQYIAVMISQARAASNAPAPTPGTVVGPAVSHRTRLVAWSLRPP